MRTFLGWMITTFCLLVMLLSHANAKSEISTPLGYWKTIDDVTGKPKAIVQISETDGKLYGKILKIFPRPGYDQREVCVACKGSRHNQRIVGMVFLENMKLDTHNKTEWTHGSILDPLNGKTYHCNFRLTEKGAKLNVRGYIGIPLFGRTQTWQRVSESENNFADLMD